MNYINGKTGNDKVFRTSSTTTWCFFQWVVKLWTMLRHYTDRPTITKSSSSGLSATWWWQAEALIRWGNVLWGLSFKTKILYLIPTLYKLTVIQKTKCQSLSEEWDRKLIDAQNIANNSFTLEWTSALGRKIMQAKLSKEKKKMVEIFPLYKKCSLFDHYHVAEKGIT